MASMDQPVNRATKEQHLSYQMYGQGMPVIFLHGFGEDQQIWNQQVTYLQNSYQVITLDLPGVGSSAPLENSPIAIVNYADCIHELLTQENIQECVLLGHSMGGYITLAFAEKYPEKLLAFGLIHSTAFADSEEKKKTRQKSIEFIETHGAFPFLRTSTPNLFAEVYRKNSAPQIEGLIEQMANIRKETLIQFTQAMMNREDKTPVLKNAAVPILFIIGTEDLAAPLQDLNRQIKIPKEAMVTILENVGHMSMMEAPAQLNHALVSFLGALKKKP